MRIAPNGRYISSSLPENFVSCERRDLFGIQAQHLTHDLMRVLAQRRRRIPHLSGCFREPHGRAHVTHAAEPRMVELEDGSTSLHLWMLDDLRDVVDRADGDVVFE